MAKNENSNNELIMKDEDNKLLYFRRTKVIATVGPASNSEEMLDKLIKSGVNLFRINFSHGNSEEHYEVVEKIRRLSRKNNKVIGILGDLCGPKIRVGDIVGGGIMLKDNQSITITTKDVVGDDKVISVSYKNLVKDVKIHDRIFFDDGRIELRVVLKVGSNIMAKVIKGGFLKKNKGVNFPDTKLNVPSLTEKDKSDVKNCIKWKLDYIALSFVRTGNDIEILKEILKKSRCYIPIIAKIEKPEAITNINDILEKSDGIMIARGDLGVEMKAQQVPILQNKLIEKANKSGKPVIVATQMLESMIENNRPTRAEVTDVANACMLGADAVMLSGETAVGNYPIESVCVMDSILRETESYQFFSLKEFRSYKSVNDNTLQQTISRVISDISKSLAIRSIIVKTNSGYTARMLSTSRPSAPIIAFTWEESVLRQMVLLWGVYPYLLTNKDDDTYIKSGEKILLDLKLAKSGDYMVILSRTKKYNDYSINIEVHRML